MIDIDRFEQFSKVLSRLSKEITKLKAKHMSKFGLGSTHVMCIIAIERKGPLTAGELAASEDVDKAQMSRVLADLTEKEIVAPINQDRKYKRQFGLTSKGSKIAAEIKEILQNIIDYVGRDISDRDIDIMFKTLIVIGRNATKASRVIE